MSLSKLDRHSLERSLERQSYAKERFIRFFGTNTLYQPCLNCKSHPEQCYVFRDGPCAAKCSTCVGLSQACSHTNTITAWRKQIKNQGWEDLRYAKITSLKSKWSKLQSNDPIITGIPKHLNPQPNTIIPKKRSLEEYWEDQPDSPRSFVFPSPPPPKTLDNTSIKEILFHLKNDISNIKNDIAKIKSALGI